MQVKTFYLLIGRAVVNALSFSGSSYLFHMLDKNGAQAEMKRHNEAMEKLEKANFEYEKHKKDTLTFLNNELKKENDAIKYFDNVDIALALYNKTHLIDKVKLMKKPELSDYYSPTQEFKNYEYLWIILGLTGVGLSIYIYRAYSKTKK